MPLGPSQQYVVVYNGEQLPGYVQSENDPNEMNLVDAYAFGWDGSQTQYAGLSNKNLSLTFRVWEPTYRACKDQYHKATTILRSRRDGFAPLYVDYTDRYFEAAVKQISYSQDVSKSRRILDYTAEFDCKPWMVGTALHTITGAGSLSTVGQSRDINSGGWSPVHAVISGTNVTISGFTATESLTGFVSISGTVSSFVIDTENSTTTDDKYMNWKDYGIWVGTGNTSWTITGASSVTFTYHDRWY